MWRILRGVLVIIFSVIGLVTFWGGLALILTVTMPFLWANVAATIITVACFFVILIFAMRDGGGASGTGLGGFTLGLGDRFIHVVRQRSSQNTHDEVGKGTHDEVGKGTHDEVGKGTHDEVGKGTHDELGIVIVLARLIATIPTLIRMGAQVTLNVQITIDPSSPRPSRAVKLSIHSPGFRLLSPPVHSLDISKTSDEISASFQMEAQEAGKHRTRVSSFVGGTYTGSVAFEVRVGHDFETGNSRTFASPVLQLGEPEKGEVTLEVHYDGHERVYSYQLSSATFTEDEIFAKPLSRPPEEALANLVRRLNERARELVISPDPDVASLWQSGLGIDLWRGFIPKQMQRQIWEHQGDIRKLTILSEGFGHMIPWEAMYPVPERGEGTDFLINQFTVVRRFFDTNPAKIFRFSQACFVLSDIDSLPRARDEIDTLKAIIGNGSEVSSLTSLISNLKQARFDLLHFACHNVFKSEDPTSSYIRLEQGYFEPPYLSNFIGRFSLQKPLIFMNACQTSEIASNYTGSAGWAESFLQAGAGAFIGTLWEVNDESAKRFAENFYRALSSGTTLSEAVKQAREAIRENSDDPSWLAYTLYGNPNATVSRM